MLAFDGLDVEVRLHHALDVLRGESLFSDDCWLFDVLTVSCFTVDGESFEDILEAHAVVGFFPHLLGEEQVRLSCIDVRIHSHRESFIHEQLTGVEVAHQERNSVPFLWGHLLEVSDVFTELDLIREPCIGYSLVVQVHGPLVLDWLQEKTIF